MFKWILKKLRNDEKGFTLVELVVVIAIVGILAAIAIPRFGGFTAGAKEGAVEANHRTIVSAAQLYYANTGEWPKTFDNLFGEYLTAADFVKDFEDSTEVEGQIGGEANDLKGLPDGATYKIDTKENECTITATYSEDKQWVWNSDAGFIRRGKEEESDG